MEAWGFHTIIDMKQCSPEKIRDAEFIKRFVIKLCELIDMKRYGECMVVDFGEEERVAGFSMVQLIETSNITAHFVNKTNDVYMDIFSCKDYSSEDATRFAVEEFEAKAWETQRLIRH